MNSNSIYEDTDVDNTWFQNLGGQIEKNDSKENVNKTNIAIGNSPILQKNNFVKENSIEMMPDYLKPYYYPRSPSPMVMFGEMNDNYHSKSPQHGTNNDVDHHAMESNDNGTLPMMTYDHYSGMYSTGLISNVTSDNYRFQSDEMEGIENKISPQQIDESNHHDNPLWLGHGDRNNSCKNNMETEYMEQKVYAELTNVNQDISKCSDMIDNNMDVVSIIRRSDISSQLLAFVSIDPSTLSHKSNILMKHFDQVMEKTKIYRLYTAQTINESMAEMQSFYAHHRGMVVPNDRDEGKNQVLTKIDNTIQNNENQFICPPVNVEECSNEVSSSENYWKDICHDNIHLMDLENFALHFKNSRIRYGFTQGDVGYQLGHIFGGEVSQTTISRFEALNLSYKNMIKQKPFLEEWLRVTQQLMVEGFSVEEIMKNKLHNKYGLNGRLLELKNLEVIPYFEEGKNENLCNKTEFKSNQNPVLKRRRKRTNLDITQREYLNRTFSIEPNPDHGKMEEIALDLGLDKEIVRVWFCNKRQKMRKFSLINGVVLSNRLY